MTQQALLQKAKMAFYCVFKNTDPFGRIFNDCISQKILLCRTDGYYLKKEQFDALIKTIKIRSESSFYVAMTEGDNFVENEINKKYHLEPRELNSDITYEEYINIPLVLENALYSINGTWGVIISHEDHAVVGGSEDFMKLFKKFYPDWQQGLKNFVVMWEYNKEQYNSNVAWVEDFLNYINS